MHRARLEGTTFIGITGSAGKTMTKLLAGAVLSSGLRGRYSHGTGNTVYRVTRSLFRHARKGDQFHIVEMSGHGPGALIPQLRLVRPRIGVVTTIGTDHYQAFGSVDAIAAEKGRLVESIPRDGVAILNADDARVLAMRERCLARVITFGLGADAMVRADHVAASWPDALSFTVVYEGSTAKVQTKLYGTQWVHAALAAVAAGIALGIPLDDAARALGEVTPSEGRMSPVVVPDGATFIRDDWKASVHTIAPALDFLAAARAKRKIAVIGTISDTSGNAGKVYVDTAKRALEVADIVCFVGRRAFAALRAAPKDQRNRLRAFAGAKAADQFLRTLIQPGDLVLLKGSNIADHLCRLVLSRTMTVACWRMDCNRGAYCDGCDLVATSSDVAGGARRPSSSPADVPDADGHAGLRFDPESGAAVLVGLGNPGVEYQGTPHNVGQALLDSLAKSLNVEWRADADASIAVGEWDGRAVWLVKPRAFVNQSGRALHRISERTGFGPEHCILVYDDLDLPLGTVRTRMRGSDGGHRGVRSVLEAFQTDEFRRVKIGVKRAGDATAAKEAVLKAFAPGERPVVDAALVRARDNLAVLIKPQSPTRTGAPLERVSH